MNIGIIGYGDHVKRNVLPAFDRAQNLACSQVYVRHPEKYNDPEVPFTNDLDAFLSNPDNEVIYICSPIPSHYGYAKAALLAGKHVWCEKSFTQTHAEATELVKLAEQENLFLAEICMFQHHQQYVEVIDIIETLGMKKIKKIHAAFCVPHMPADSTRYSLDESGGALLDIGFYPLALAEAVFGMPDKITRHIYSEEGYHVDTGGSAELFYGKLVFEAEWQQGGTYQNYIHFETDDGEIHIDRTFSKPHDLVTEMKSTVAAIPAEIIPADDQFVNIYNNFASRINSVPCKNLQRQDILARSLIRERVLGDYQQNSSREKRLLG